jgi:hypothetical protein
MRVIRGQLALPRALSCETHSDSSFSRKLGSGTLLCVAMQLTGWEAGLPGHQDGYLPF